ncbi:hypothetical protein B0T25DRAFT_561587 [Lasiosphaeria hispida]|uniref:Uncharacterized protein n=1 Tax=Lasiosphaeria hispida TaxID=260671 RepID=A0AAJ0MJ82_9PEZI|nr:hypothetical protein B0T25DRAFT_561587 [Lasiosphaeria hispida]
MTSSETHLTQTAARSKSRLNVMRFFVALSLGRDLLMPWRRLRHKWFDMTIAIVGFCIALSMTILALHPRRRLEAGLLNYPDRNVLPRGKNGHYSRQVSHR